MSRPIGTSTSYITPRERAQRPRRTNRALRCALAALCAAPSLALWPIGTANAAITITVQNVTTTLDESPLLQTAGTTDTGNDVAAGSLPEPFKTRLTQLGVDYTSNGSHPVKVGVSRTVDEFIDVDSDAPLETLGLTDSNGNPFAGIVAPGIKTLDDGNVHLYSDLNNQIVLGRRPPNGLVLGAVVFAVYMDRTIDSDGTTDIKLWTVTTEPLKHPTNPNPDDRVDIFDIVHVTATAAIVFDFNDLPSGQNLFGIVGPSKDDPAIVVFGLTPVLNADGTFTNASDTINTSKGGGPTTIGVDNQLFDEENEGAYFTYIDKPVESFLAGAPGGLSQGEADDADNIQYNGGLVEVDKASVLISQIQGGGPASIKISAFNLAGAPQEEALIAARGTGTTVSIKTVRVFDDNGILVEAETDGQSTTPNDPDIDIVFSGGVATVTGLEAGFLVEFDTGPDFHDQALIQHVAGKFDIGAFGINRADRDSESLNDRLFVDDDGPTLAAIANGLVDFVAGARVDDKPVTGVVGTDAPGTYAFTSFTPPPTVNLVPLRAVNTGTEVIYYQELGGNNTFDPATDKKYFQLSLDPLPAVTRYIFEVFFTPEAPPLIFNFNALPSGQNLFGMVGVGDDEPALIIIGAAPVINDPGDGTYTNASDTINTSKGGGPTTIGVDNQMFDVGDGAYFTFVDDPDTRFLAGVSGGLTQGEADDADSIQFDGGFIPVDSASFRISQLQGGGTATAKITAFDITTPPADYQERNFVKKLGDVGGDIVFIDEVRVYNASGTVIEDAARGNPTPNPNAGGIVVTFNPDGSAQVSGLGAGFRVEWVTDGDHEQALVQGAGGKFDIGDFTVNEPQDTPDQRLEFTVTLTDRDNDPVQQTFAVCIDGNNDNATCV